MKSIPEEVVVCGVRWRVKFFEDGDPSSWQGKCDYDTTTIYIRPGLSHERQLETFLHELGHAVAEESGYHYLVSNPSFAESFEPEERDEILTRVFVRAYVTALEPLYPKADDGLPIDAEVAKKAGRRGE